MNKKITKCMALACAFATTASLAACNVGAGTKGSDTDQTLEVFVLDAGYGVNWCQGVLDAFAQEDWVKAKYPELEIIFDSDESGSAASTKMEAGEGSNTLDLIMLTGFTKYYGKFDKDGVKDYEYMTELSDCVFNTEVPGEGGITVLEKLLPTYRDSIRYYEKGQDSNNKDEIPFKSYGFPWASGMDGILYNEDILNALNIEVPLTTNEFLDACEKITNDKSKAYGKGYAIMRAGDSDYWEYIYPIWWGQYEGIDEFYNFYNGVSDGEISPEVQRQRGKLHSLTALEKTLKWDNGYVYQYGASLKFMEAQTNFLSGLGAFMANGDWFAEEMKEMQADLKNEGIDYNIRMMQTPVISEIIEKTPSIETEEELREVIKKVDAGYTQVSETGLNVTQADYEIIMHARGIVHSIGASHDACIPSYAKGKEVACDFLRFMATDKAQEIYMSKTGGASLPFNYDVKKENPTLYATFSSIEKDRLSYLYEQGYETNVLPSPNSFPLVKFGGMATVRSLDGQSIVAYFASKGSEASAKTVYEKDIEYYITNSFNFDTCLYNAGLK